MGHPSPLLVSCPTRTRFDSGLDCFFFIIIIPRDELNKSSKPLVRSKEHLIPQSRVCKGASAVNKERHALLLAAQHDVRRAALLHGRPSLRPHVCYKLLPRLHVLDRVHAVVSCGELAPGLDPDLGAASEEGQLGDVSKLEDPQEQRMDSAQYFSISVAAMFNNLSMCAFCLLLISMNNNYSALPPWDGTDTKGNDESSADESCRDDDAGSERCQGCIHGRNALRAWQSSWCFCCCC